MKVNEKMAKPIKPIMPNAGDRKKYPPEPHPANEKTPFIIDYKKYAKDIEQYNIDLELYEQMKYINLIKVANMKLCLKKFKIIKK